MLFYLKLFDTQQIFANGEPRGVISRVADPVGVDRIRLKKITRTRIRHNEIHNFFFKYKVQFNLDIITVL